MGSNTPNPPNIIVPAPDPTKQCAEKSVKPIIEEYYLTISLKFKCLDSWRPDFDTFQSYTRLQHIPVASLIKHRSLLASSSTCPAVKCERTLNGPVSPPSVSNGCKRVPLGLFSPNSKQTGSVWHPPSHRR
ncbi:hypothetical protein ACET3Z_000671 [Daucus carota]